MEKIDIENLREEEKGIAELFNSGDQKPFMRICDGYAVQCKEDKTITTKNEDGSETTRTFKKGEYIVRKKNNWGYAELEKITAEDFEMNHAFINKEKPKAKKPPVLNLIGRDGMINGDEEDNPNSDY